MAVRLTWPLYTRLDLNGDPISGAQLFFYEAGTTKKLDTFSDEALTSANANPMVANGSGEFSDIFLKLQDYKLILTSATDTDPPTGGTTFDPVQGNPAVSGDDYKAGPQSPADLTALLTAGSLFRLGTRAIVTNAAQTSPAVVAPSVNPRNDIVHIDRLTGVVAITTGSEAPSPVDPTIPVGKLPVARINLAITTTSIDSTLIEDIRELEQIGDLGPEDLQGQTFTAFDDTGAADAYVITPIPPITAYAKYQTWVVDIANANTGASTMNISGLGTRNIFDYRTAAALTGGEVLAGLNTFIDDGTQLILMNPIGSTSIVEIIDRNMVEAEIVNTVTETTTYSFSVPANTLGTNKALRVTIQGDYLNNSGAVRTYRLRIKYGATTLLDDTAGNITASASRRPYTLEFILSAVNSTSAQQMNGIHSLSNSTATTGEGGIGGVFDVASGVFSGTSAEDSTGALTLDVTIEHSLAAATISWRAHQRIIELLP